MQLERAGFGPGRVKLPAKGRRTGGQRKFSDEYQAAVAADVRGYEPTSGARKIGAEVAREYFGATS